MVETLADTLVGVLDRLMADEACEILTELGFEVRLTDHHVGPTKQTEFTEVHTPLPASQEDWRSDCSGQLIQDGAVVDSIAGEQDRDTAARELLRAHIERVMQAATESDDGG